ncbi:MAG: Spo0B domain-containing protein [Clostridia bacterium]|nr:Spo0B domain-containing protein [Clostridia bacterium]
MQNSRRPVDVKKTAILVLVINSLQIVMMAVILLLAFLLPQQMSRGLVGRTVVLLAAAVVVSGAVVDIRDALNTRRLMEQAEQMEATIRNLVNHNNTLRAQRHDFMSHLQVVFSLVEMQEYDEANRYIEKIYGKINAVSRVMKTASAPVNALLQVKLAACEKAGVSAELEIHSRWDQLPMEGWEMCKVLSNLIDNALDALAEFAPAEKKRLWIRLTEDLHSYRFEVGDNGPMIPPELQKRIFQPGVTTKAEGHGTGLAIVAETLKRCGGEITVTSEPGETVFAGSVPRGQAPQAGMEKEA